MSLAIAWLALSAMSCLLVAADVARAGGQRMWIMDLVWPITALWAGPIGGWAYVRFGRADNRRSARAKDDRTAVVVAKATSHCGAGCTLGDLVALGVAALVPLSVGGHEIFGEWIYGFVAAFALGILFQYFTIKPMRHLSRRDGLVAALEADALSLTAWQVGMYGWMAIARFAIVGRPLDEGSATFWVTMQAAMLAGFVVSYPVNALLIRHGLKERM
ncbi:MAG TPA: DUF4396 domain-containing protein [Kofleriaceae bacterium]|nr:DUF4396 domain-containing protein [Kofleriaceae bacterium]